VKALDSPPILIGHSAGGVFTQILTPQSSICHVLRWHPSNSAAGHSPWIEHDRRLAAAVSPLDLLGPRAA
jgi:hypothetical protein